MTIEEAGEEILRGPFTGCERCGGQGLEPKTRVDAGDRDWLRFSFNICKGCGGPGLLYRPEYLAACDLLGVTIAKMPSKVLAFDLETTMMVPGLKVPP